MRFKVRNDIHLFVRNSDNIYVFLIYEIKYNMPAFWKAVVTFGDINTMLSKTWIFGEPIKAFFHISQIRIPLRSSPVFFCVTSNIF